MFGLRTVGSILRHLSSSLRAKPIQLSAVSSSPIPQHELVDEEHCPAYNPKVFYPAKPGETLAERYQLLVKIGWGTRSTVWLAQDMARYRWQSGRLLALKIINTDIYEGAHHEWDTEKHIIRQNTNHRGRGILRTSLESFEVAGPEGNHICLAYEPMREPLWILQNRFVGNKLPLSLAKAYILILLTGLDYLHTQCRVVHTDLKLENILMTFENDSILPNFIKEHTTNLSMEYKPESTTGRNIYRCHNNFGPLDWRELKRMVHKITDFGMGARLDSGKGEFGINPIQPDHYRAPEVIVGCGWDSSADIWNFGVLVWDIIGSTGLFRQVHDAHGRYDAKAHLAEMIALLGTPPKELLAKSQAMVQQKWPEPIESEADRLCWNAQEFFDGPFFNTDGEFLHSNLISSRSLETAVPSLEDKERETFLSFVRCMLAWIPGKRKTARELIEHPFLNLKGR